MLPMAEALLPWDIYSGRQSWTGAKPVDVGLLPDPVNRQIADAPIGALAI
jgi:hypothetical protein